MEMRLKYETIPATDPLAALLAVIDGFMACPTCGAKRAHPDVRITHRDGCELAAAVERLEVR